MDRKVVEVSSFSLFFSLFLSLSLSFSLFLSLSLSFSLFLWLPTYLPTDLSMYLSIHPSIYLSIFPSVCLSIHLSIYPSICLPTYLSLSLCLSVYLSVYLQAWKGGYSARIPQFLNLTTSKRQQFSETSSVFALDNVKNESSARLPHFLSWQHQKRSNSGRLPSEMESWVQSWRPRTNAFCYFSSPSVQTTAPATKKWCQVIRRAAPVTQNHLSKPEDLMLQNATPLRKSVPGPPSISDEHVSCTATAMESASLQILFKCPTPAIVFGTATKPSRFAKRPKCSEPLSFFHFWLWNVRRARTACTALFRHRNFYKYSEAEVFCTFWLRNVLRATTADTFSTSQLPKVVRACCVFNSLTSKCASRHNGVQFFISHLTTWLRTRRFSEPTLRPSGATNHWKKHSVLRLSHLFAHLDLLSSGTFSFLTFFLLLCSSLTLPISAFHLSILSEVWLLNFLRKLQVLLLNRRRRYDPSIIFPQLSFSHFLGLPSQTVMNKILWEKRCCRAWYLLISSDPIPNMLIHGWTTINGIFNGILMG